ncbi:MAG: DNA-binding protein [Acidobacteria bacterium]|nr:MAG: DNA-binding protein [Acidobacteriota bacterium]
MLLENHDAPPVTSEALVREPLTEATAATRLGLKVATLRAWRHQGRGPAYVRLGRAIRYLPGDLDDFLRANRYGPDSDTRK